MALSMQCFLGFDAKIGGFGILGWEVKMGGKRRSNIKGFLVSSFSEL